MKKLLIIDFQVSMKEIFLKQGPTSSFKLYQRGYYESFSSQTHRLLRLATALCTISLASNWVFEFSIQPPFPGAAYIQLVRIWFPSRESTLSSGALIAWKFSLMLSWNHLPETEAPFGEESNRKDVFVFWIFPIQAQPPGLPSGMELWPLAFFYHVPSRKEIILKFQGFGIGKDWAWRSVLECQRMFALDPVTLSLSGVRISFRKKRN